MIAYNVSEPPDIHITFTWQNIQNTLLLPSKRSTIMLLFITLLFVKNHETQNSCLKHWFPQKRYIKDILLFSCFYTAGNACSLANMQFLKIYIEPSVLLGSLRPFFPTLMHLPKLFFFFLTSCSWTHCQLVLTSQKWMTTWWMPSLNTSLLENLSVIKISTEAVIIIRKRGKLLQLGVFNKNIPLYVNDGFQWYFQQLFYI